jgi:hypothetical protein
MNSISLLGAASLNESAQFTLDEATSTAQHYLSAIASSEDFVTKVAIAFGDSFDAATVEGLRQEWLVGDFDLRKPITCNRLHEKADVPTTVSCTHSYCSPLNQEDGYGSW